MIFSKKKINWEYFFLIRLTLLYWPESYKAWTLDALMSRIAKAFVVFKDLSNLSSWVVMVAMLSFFLNFLETSELFEVSIANDWIYQNDCLDISSMAAIFLDFWLLKLFFWNDQIIKHFLQIYPYSATIGKKNGNGSGTRNS